MRGTDPRLNQTQRIRLRTALEKLESLSSKVNSDASVIVADSIPINYEDAVLKGHGTQDRTGRWATLCGVVVIPVWLLMGSFTGYFEKM